MPTIPYIFSIRYTASNKVQPLSERLRPYSWCSRAGSGISTPTITALSRAKEKLTPQHQITQVLMSLLPRMNVHFTGKEFNCWL